MTEAVAGHLGTRGHLWNFPPVGPNGHEDIFYGTRLFSALSDSSHLPDNELIAKVQNQFKSTLSNGLLRLCRHQSIELRSNIRNFK